MRRSRIFYPRSRPQVVDQFLRFGIVGVTGLMVDWGTLELFRPALGLPLATLGAYFVAASSNWVLNRLWTFRLNDDSNHHFVLQWLRFLLANSLGFMLNRGMVFVLFETIPFTRSHPIVALAAGAASGMIANFNLSRRLVFRAPVPETPLELVQMAVQLPGTTPEPPAPEPDLNLLSRNAKPGFEPPP